MRTEIPDSFDSTRLAFNLINSIDLSATEARIRDYQEQNATDIAEKAARQISDRAFALAQEEEERQERQRTIKKAHAEAEELERKMESLKKQAFDSIARGKDGQVFYKEMEQIRKNGMTENSIAAGTRKKAKRLVDNVQHLPTSPSYSGPFVPTPFAYKPSRVEKLARPDLTGLPTIQEMGTNTISGLENPRYNDIESIDRQLAAHEKLVRVRAGGFDLREVWERDLRLSLEALLIPPLGRFDA
jgi:hypothetical protein